MNIRKIILIVCMLFVVGCGDSNNGVVERKFVEYVPDSNQFYIKALTDRPAEISLLPQDVEPCFLDVINNQSANGVNMLAVKSQVHMSGWAGDVVNGRSPKIVWLEFDGIRQNTGFYYIKAINGVKRKDVAEIFGKSGLFDAGWNVYVDLSLLADGVYEVHVIMLVDQYWMTCDTKRLIQI